MKIYNKKTNQPLPVNVYLDEGWGSEEIENICFNPIKLRGCRYFPSIDTTEENPKLDGAKQYPIYAYVHSGCAFSTSPFSCQWDSSPYPVGAIWAVSEEAAGKDLQRLQDVINGQVYTIEHGDDIEYSVTETDLLWTIAEMTSLAESDLSIEY